MHTEAKGYEIAQRKGTLRGHSKVIRVKNKLFGPHNQHTLRLRQKILARRVDAALC
jgi:hypothetical protein